MPGEDCLAEMQYLKRELHRLNGLICCLKEQNSAYAEALANAQKQIRVADCLNEALLAWLAELKEKLKAEVRKERKHPSRYAGLLQADSSTGLVASMKAAARQGKGEGAQPVVQARPLVTKKGRGLGQLEDMPSEGTLKPKARNGKEGTGTPRTGERVPAGKTLDKKPLQALGWKVPRWKIWADLIGRGMPREKIDGLPTPELYKLWEEGKGKRKAQVRQTMPTNTGVGSDMEDETPLTPLEEDLINLGIDLGPHLGRCAAGATHPSKAHESPRVGN